MTESINLKLKLDSSDIQGLMGGKSVGMGTIAGGIAGGMGIFSGIKYSLDKLVQSSPQLQGSIMMLQKSLEMLLRPIGDVIGMWIRPLAIKLLQFTMKHGEAAKDIGAVLAIAGVSVAGGIGIAAIAKLLGVGTITTVAATAGGVATTSIALPAALAIGSILFGGYIASLTGGGGLSNIFVGAIAAAAGLSVVLLTGGTFALAVPVALVSAAGAGLAQGVFGDLTKENPKLAGALAAYFPHLFGLNWILERLFGKTETQSEELKDATTEDILQIIDGTAALKKAIAELPTDKQINITVNTNYTTSGAPSGAAVSSGLGLYAAVPKEQVTGNLGQGWQTLYDLATTAGPGATAGDVIRRQRTGYTSW